MSEKDVDREFRQVVDSFISLANDHLDGVPKENVSMALLYAASRFNSFVVATHCSSGEQFESERPRAVEFFTTRYQEMLNENLDDYGGTFSGQAKYAFLERGEKES